MSLYFEAANLLLLTVIVLLLLMDEPHIKALRRCCSKFLFHKFLPRCPDEDQPEEELQTASSLGQGPWAIWVSDEGTWGTRPPRLYVEEVKTRCALRQAVQQAAAQALEGEILCLTTETRQRFGRNVG